MRPGPVFLFLYEIFLFLSEFLFLYVFVKFFNSVIATDRRERRNLLDMRIFKPKCRKRPFLVALGCYALQIPRLRAKPSARDDNAADRCGCRPVRPVESNVFSV